MINGEPLLGPWLEATPQLGWLSDLVIPLVLVAGFFRNHRHLESRIHARPGVAGASAAAPPRQRRRRSGTS